MEEEKSKSALRAERRAKQEAQRAAKALGQDGASASKKQAKGGQPKQTKQPTEQSNRKAETSSAASYEQASAQITNDARKVTFADEAPAVELEANAGRSLDAAFVELAAQCGGVVGSDAQCVALVAALRQFAASFVATAAFGRELEAALEPQMTALTGGRPLPPGVGNLVKQLKHFLSEMPVERDEQQARDAMLAWLDEFVQQKIQLAHEAISLNARGKLQGDQVIMVYHWCPVVEKVLTDAVYKNDIKFKVVVVDSTEQSGIIMLRNLLKAGIECSYAPIKALAYVIWQCHLVLLGADAILANGNVLAAMGTSQVALVARAHNLPVLVACPTYKFVEKVQMSAPDAVGGGVGAVFASFEREVTPADLVSGIVTELRILPSSSASAVLRVKQLATG